MIDRERIPKHIAIIMDGNGRWAREKKLPRTAGHRKGIQRVKELLKAAAELGVKYITLFAFSTENWNRPKKETDMLMRSLDIFLKKELPELNKNKVRLIVIGEDAPLPDFVRKTLKHAQKTTEDNRGLVVVLALNYGARQEILNTARKFARQVQEGRQSPEGLDEKLFSSLLYTGKIPDPDLLIRTSGEMRISNFLLWQISYAELYFPEKYWPDFGKEDLKAAIEEFQARERRFGRIKTVNKDA